MAEDIQGHLSRIKREERGEGENRRTMWEDFERERAKDGQHNAHILVILMTLGWTLHGIYELTILSRDHGTDQVLPYFLAFKGFMLLDAILCILVTSMKRFNVIYCSILAFCVTVFCISQFMESTIVDILIREKNLTEISERMHEVAPVLVSGTLGSHQTLFLVVIITAIRYAIPRQKYLIITLCSILVSWFLNLIILSTVYGEDGVSFRDLSTGDHFRAVASIMMTVVVSLLLGYYRTKQEWSAFVHRKRLQFTGVRAEELLSLAMPRDIAHRQMLGATTTRESKNASVAFIYISDYDKLVDSASQAGDLINFMEDLNELVRRLDKLILTHANVCKVGTSRTLLLETLKRVNSTWGIIEAVVAESVGNCYMVSSGITQVYELQEDPSHSQHLLSFCVDAMEMCSRFREELCVVGEKDSSRKGSNRCYLKTQWRFQMGMHNGGLSSGVIGQTRTFFRLFGDTVNTAARIASKASPWMIFFSESFYAELERPPLDSSVFLGEKSVSCRISYLGYIHMKGKGLVPCYGVALRDKDFTPRSPPQVWCVPRGGSSSDYSTLPPEKDLIDGESHVGRNHKMLEGQTSVTAPAETALSKGCSSFQRTQRIIVDSSNLLRISLVDALKSYKRLQDTITSSHESLYVEKVECLYLSRYFPSLYENHCGDTERKPSVHESKESYPKREDVNKVNLFRSGFLFPGCSVVAPKTWLKWTSMEFVDSTLEKLYQRRVYGFLYDMSRSSCIAAEAFVILAVIGYSNELDDHPALSMFFGALAVLVTIMGHAMLKRFAWIEVEDEDCSTNKTEKQGQQQGCCEEELSEELSEDVQSITVTDESSPNSYEEDGRLHPMVNHSKGSSSPSIMSKLVSLRDDFTAWISCMSLLVMGIVTGMDQLTLSNFLPERSDGELCLSSFVAPVIVLSMCQIFYSGVKTQTTSQVLSAALFFFIHLGSGRIISCEPKLLVLGYFFILQILVVGLIDSINADVTMRKSSVLKYASCTAKRQSDKVLSLLFPRCVLSRLLNNEQVAFQYHEGGVVILWADLVGFTALSSTKSSSEMARILHALYAEFDKLVEAEHLWKMDTIGDAYVVIGGLSDGQTANVVDKQFRIAGRMACLTKRFARDSGLDIAARIGIHSGPVASGIVGKLRPRYHIFGNTVIEAERMEHTSAPNQIQVSTHTAALYNCFQFSLVPNGSLDTSSFASPIQDESATKSYWLRLPECPEETLQ